MRTRSDSLNDKSRRGSNYPSQIRYIPFPRLSSQSEISSAAVKTRMIKLKSPISTEKIENTLKSSRQAKKAIIKTRNLQTVPIKIMRGPIMLIILRRINLSQRRTAQPKRRSKQPKIKINTVSRQTNQRIKNKKRNQTDLRQKMKVQVIFWTPSKVKCRKRIDIFIIQFNNNHQLAKMTTMQKIAEIEAEMERTQKNKATSYHLGLLKAKLAKLKREIIEPTGGKKGAAGEGFEVSKSGDARVGMIGFPSVGKSTLLTKLTGTFSKIAAYQFTTLTCIPGVLRYKGAKIQLLDLPGIIEGAKDGKGRGKQVIAVARTCNLIIIVLDATRPMQHKKIIQHQLQGFGIRLNKQPAEIDFKRKDKGGVTISRMVETDRVSDETIKAILKEYKINNADILIKCDATEDDIIDVIEGNRKYIPCLYALNKIDAITLDQLNILDQIDHYVPIAGDLQWNLDQLIDRMWEYLDLIRVYTKPKGKDPDYEQPVIIQRCRSTIEDFCNKIHRNMIKDFRYGMVWGTSVKFNPQKVGKDHQLYDEDVVQIIKKI